MQNKKLILSALFLLGFAVTGLKAQEAILSAGGNVAGSGGSSSYSIGQVAYTNNAATAGSLAQGVQQPYDISVESAMTEARGISLVCSVYPNPASDLLILKVEYKNPEVLVYQLFDINGKLLENKELTGDETSIDMGNLAPSTYYLKVIKDKIELKTFKIIKK